MIPQMFVSAIAIGALVVVPDMSSMLVVLGCCAAGGFWALREQEAPASRATTQAVERSRTVIGELDVPVRARERHSPWEIDA